MYSVFSGSEAESGNDLWIKPLAFIFSEISSNETRAQGIFHLQTYVAEQTQHMKGDVFVNFMSNVNRHIKDSINSTSPQTVLSGILALNALLNVEYDTNDRTFIFQWINYLRTVLHNPENTHIAQEASKCLGKLARVYQGVMPREFIDNDIREALDWLASKQSSLYKRQTAVYILSQLIRNVPNLIFIEHVETFINLMSYPLQLPESELRSSVVDVVKWSLQLIKHRVPEDRYSFYQKVYAIVELIFRDTNSSADSFHGALLLLGVLFTETGTGFMNDKHQRVLEILYYLRDYSSSTIRRTIIQLIPNIAKFYPEIFVQNYLQKWTPYLLSFTSMKKPERPFALEAIGNMALYLNKQIKPQAQKIMAVIYGAFITNSRAKYQSSQILTPELFYCFSSMVQALGEEFEPHVLKILPYMFAADFTQPLVDCLATIAQFIPNIRKDIQNNLLNIISLILAKEPLPSISLSQKYTFMTGSDSMKNPSLRSSPKAAPKRESAKEDVNVKKKWSAGSSLETSISSTQSSNLNSQSGPSESTSWMKSSSKKTKVPSSGSETAPVQSKSARPWFRTLFSFQASPTPRHQPAAPSKGAQAPKSSSGLKELANGFGTKETGADTQNLFKNLTSLNSDSGSEGDVGPFDAKGIPLTPGGSLPRLGIQSLPLRVTSPMPSAHLSLTKNINLSSLRKQSISSVHNTDESSDNSGTSYGAPVRSTSKSVSLDPTSSNPINLDSTIPSNKVTDEASNSKLVLALDTLATFEFDPEVTRHFIHRVVVNYLNNENTTIKEKSVVACAKLLSQQVALHPTRQRSSEMIIYVLKRLIAVALTDLDPETNITVLTSLDTRFDSYLVQPIFLKQIFMFLHHHIIEIRELSIVLLGRLSTKNPGYIYPAMRATFLELYEKINKSDLNTREYSIKLIGLIIQNFPELARLYVKPLAQMLISIAQENRSLYSSVHTLAAIGDLAEVTDQELMFCLDELLQLVIDAFQDLSSGLVSERALKTLSQVIESTGYVIEPFIKYPKLLDTILGKIKREDSIQVRRDLVKLLGIIGALDPYKHKENQIAIMEADGTSGIETVNELKMKNITIHSPEFYPVTALQALIKLLMNPYGPHTSLQPLVIQAVTAIFKTLGTKCVPYLKHFLPLFQKVMKVCGNTIFEFQKLVFQQLSIIVSIIKQYTYDYQNQLFEICLTYWSDPKLIEHIIALIEQIFFALGDKFSSCLVFLLPKMLQTLQESAQNVRVVQGILRCFKAFGQMVENCIHLILPVVMQLIVDSPKVLFYSQNAYSSPPPRPYGPESDVAKSKQIQFVAICYLSELTLNHDISKYAISIIHHITKYLEHAHSDMVEPCVEVLSNIAVRLNQNFEVFVPMIYATFSKLSIRSIRFNIICQSILNKKPIPIIPSNIRASSIFSSSSEGHQPDGCDKQEQEADSNYYLDNFSFTSEFDSKNGLLNFFWNTGQSFTKADWYEWFRRFSIVLLSGSSSQALRCCVPLVKAQYSLALELFNVGFISCWEQLSDELRMQLTDSLKNALSSNIPAEILQILLNLVEFLEHHEQCLPIDNKTLASLAIKCHAYAKALHYKEAEFFQQMSPALMEDIIFLNYKLQLHEAAQGMLKLAQDTGGVVIKLSWYEKLIRWSTALEAYESLQLKHPDDIEITVGRMRCMHDLGDWDALSDLCRKTWALQKNGPKKLEIATLALSAALNSFQWDMIETYVDYLPVQSLDGSFYRAFMYVYKQDSQQAADYIAVARELAATELTALIGESYSCAYSVVVRIQQLTELEEILMIKQWNGKYPEKEKNILNLWKKRLQGVERNVEVWQSLLNVRSLVEPPRSVVYWWTKFANLVRKSDRPKKAQRILTYLLTGQNAELSADDPVPDTFPMVKYAYLNLLWQTPKTSEWAYRKMEEWVSHFSANTIISARDKARCYAKLSCWHLRAYGEHLNDAAIQRIVRTSKLAIENAPDWYRAWHVWAYANYRFVSHLEKSSDHANLDCYLLSAITGLIKAIVLSSKNNLQDILQLLMLWFKYGTKKDVELAMLDGFNVISVEKWLLVIPQLMARVHASHRSVSQGIHSILTALGKSHPQMLVFPLMVAKRSPYPLRASAAQSILTSIRSHSMELVDEAILVSTELIRIAILWKEKWYKGLDEASYYYYVEKKVDSMTIVLQHLNDMLEKGAETLSEQAFIKAFGKDLSKAWEEVKDYLKTKNASSIQAAWKLYGHVFRAIKRQFMQDSDRIHLKNVSPRLLGMSNLSLSVPGTYRVGSAVIRIKRFNPVLKVIPSKRKPRKVIVNGMDGVDYGFLLKGHEDLRQDERVMQLFGLVNTFLSSDPNTSKVHLSIRRFEVVPLSSNTGLIEWVPHCDTIHELIKHYRKLHSIPLDAEQIIITSLVPKPDISSYYKLTLMQKVCVFQAALDGTSRLDLGRAFYLNSKGAEDWLERRTSYTRSLAVISIVGYILGLGDRHPNNFLLSRSSGKILHIDFGDCFEVAMQRESHPEKVPFRLTRMMVGAMEACGICGTFRITCESVMRVLRSNSDSILTVLEAFVHDPFINWRLVTPFIGPFSYTGTLEDCANTLATHQNHPSSIDLEGEGCIRAPAAATSASRKIDINNLCAPDTDMHETLNSESLKAIQRVSNKLSGADFPGKGPLNEATQVGFLIREATSIENLCSAFLGFCAYW